MDYARDTETTSRLQSALKKNAGVRNMFDRSSKEKGGKLDLDGGSLKGKVKRA